MLGGCELGFQTGMRGVRRGTFWVRGDPGRAGVVLFVKADISMVIVGVVAAWILLGVVIVELPFYLAMRGVVASLRAGRSAQGRTSEAVIVLGFPPRRDGRTNAVQRWRCRIAVRSLDPGRSSVLIMTGAATPGLRSEAEVMAGYTRDILGVPAEQIMLEEQARSTWDNITYSLPLAE